MMLKTQLYMKRMLFENILKVTLNCSNMTITVFVFNQINVALVSVRHLNIKNNLSTAFQMN